MHPLLKNTNGLFFDDKPYPNQEVDTCYILLKDMPNVEAIKHNNSTLNPIRTDKISECNPGPLTGGEVGIPAQPAKDCKGNPGVFVFLFLGGHIFASDRKLKFSKVTLK